MRSLRFTLLLLAASAVAHAGTFTVTNNSPTGPGSLYQAINDVINSPDPTNTINFSVGSGPVSIKPGFQFATIFKPVIIDGTTQPGYAGTPIVELDGGGCNVHGCIGLRLAGGNSTVKGMVVNDYSNHDGMQGLGAAAGIALASSNNTVTDCYIGTDITGSSIKKNDVGVRIENGASNNVIGTNSGSVATRNLISGNDAGIESDWGDAPTTGTVIRGNYFGYNSSGAPGLDNYWAMYLAKLSNGTVGGTEPGQGNLFVNKVASVTSSNVQWQGNRFGVNGTLTATGLVIGYGSGNTVGGTAPGAGNTFIYAYPEALGIQKSPNNVVQGNTFTNCDVAIYVSHVDEPGTANNNLIGGTADGAGNTIRNTTHPGWGAVDVYGATGTRILRNSIYNSAGPTIDLGHDGLTANDAGDGDSGANNLQNYPLISAVTSGNGTTTIVGTLSSNPFGSYRIEFFSNPACHGDGHGEAQTFIGFTNMTTDASGLGAINVTLDGTVPVGSVVAATATDAGGNTSEFSTCATVTNGGAFRVTTPALSVGEGAGNAVVTIERISGSAGSIAVNVATQNGTATAGSDFTAVNGTLTFGDGELSKTVSIPIIQDSIYEGNETFRLALSAGAGAIMAVPAATDITIIDDDTPSHGTITDASVTEGNAGTTPATFTVTLSPAPTETSTVQWTTVNGTATAPSDFTAASGTLTFAAGETTKTITILVNGDTVYEPNETFTVALSNPVNILLDRAAGVGTIINDDPQPTVSADDVSVIEGNSGTTNVTIKLKSNQPLSAAIGFATVDGTATAGSDYTAANGTVTFNDETEKEITVQVLGDTTPERDEQFTVHLTAADPAVQLAHPNVAVTIVNDDVSLTPAVLTLGTGVGGNLVVDVGNAVASAQTLAVAKSDACLNVATTATIAAGGHIATIPVTAVTSPCNARVDVTLPPTLFGGIKLSAGVRTYPLIDLAFDPASPQLVVGQSITEVVKATPLTDTITLALASTNANVEVPPSVDVAPNGGGFTLHALKSGPIAVEVTLPAQYGGVKVVLTGTVTEAPATATLLDVSPKSGARTGGTPVSLAGTNFTRDCAVAFDGLAASNVNFISAARIDATTPPHKPGAVDVTVTCNGHASTLRNGFVYTGGAPDITGVSPASGSTAGGTTVRVSGRDLTSDCWVEFGGVLAHSVIVSSATEMIATTPAHDAGAVTVKLRCNGGAAGALPNAFTYVTAAEPSPVVTGVDPLSAEPGQQVTILGTRFRATDGVAFDASAAQVLSTTPDAHVVVVPSLPAGKVSVTAAGSTTGPIFTVLDPEAPKVAKLTPPVVPSGAELTIDGSGFRAPYTFTIGGAVARIVSMSFNRAVVRVPSLAAGRWDLDIVRGNDVAAVGGTVTVAPTGIVAAGATPQCIASDGGTVVSIAGSGFAEGATVTINGTPATHVTVVDAGHIDATTPALPPGFATIVVTNASGDNGSATNAVRAYSPLDPDGCVVAPRPRPVHR